MIFKAAAVIMLVTMTVIIACYNATGASIDIKKFHLNNIDKYK